MSSSTWRRSAWRSARSSAYRGRLRSRVHLAGADVRPTAPACWAPPLAIGLLAAVLRLWAIDLAPFAYDEVDVLGRARAVLSGELTQVGPLTSWGIPDPPVSVYLMVLPSILPRPAVASAAWMAILGVAAVVLTYLIARRFFGPWVAVSAGLLFAVNPWAIYFSRRTWAEIVPLFTVVAVWAALEVICRHRSRWAVAFFLALALQIQTRILAAIYAPAALLSIAAFPRRWGVRWPAVGIALGVLVSVPYVVYVLGHWSEMAARLAEGNRGIEISGKNSAPTLLLWAAAGYGLLPAASKAAPWLDPLGQAGRATMAILAALLLSGFGLVTWAFARRRAGAEGMLLPAAWLLLPLLALMAQSSSVYLHYMVALFPALFLVIAFPLAALLSSCRGPAVLAGATLLLTLVGVQLATTVVLYRILAAYEVDESATAPIELRQAAATIPREASDQLGTGERYGVEVPLRFWQTLADRTHVEAAQVGVGDVWVLAGATDPLIAERPALLDYLLRPRLEPRFLPPDTLVFPIDRPGLVLEAPDVETAEPLERFGTRRAVVPIPSTNRAGRDAARLTLVQPRSVEAWIALAPNQRPNSFRAGVHLLGYRASRTARGGEDWPIVTYWRLDRNAAPTLPNVSVRLASDRAAPLEQAERVDVAPLVTPVEERIMIRRQQIPIPSRTPEGDYRLEIGATDPQGRPIGRADGSSDRLGVATIRVSAR